MKIRINIVRCIDVNKIEITVLSARVLDALSVRGLKAKTVREFERYGTRRIVQHCLDNGQTIYFKETVQDFVWQERARMESGALPHYQWVLTRRAAVYLDQMAKHGKIQGEPLRSWEAEHNLFFTFLETAKAIPRQRANWSHFTRQNIQEFMDWLEKVRNCNRQTQLQRLAAIRSFVRYGGIIDLRVISIQADVEKIRYRKPAPALVGYLTKEGLSAFLSQPNCQKRTGFRNMVFLVLMYDTAARCQEMLDLRIQDLVLHRTSPCVYLTGKGNKTRVVPILPKTAEHLRSYLKKFHPADNRKRDDYVFYAYGGPQRPMSPDTVTAFVKKYGESARQACTSIPARVHPHMLRHTRAMHLYQDGIPLAMVSEFLGHAQIETTKIYAHADTEMKRKAIQQAANKLNDTIPDALWNTDDEEMMLKLRGKQQYK